MEYVEKTCCGQAYKVDNREVISKRGKKLEMAPPLMCCYAR